MSTINATQIITEVPGIRGATRSRPAAASSQAGLASIRREDPMRDAVARAAAKAGMSLEAWIERTDRIEAAENGHRRADRMMRQIPRYRNEVAA